jgi:hypothetical protein
LIVASLFIAWALLRPLRRELEEADAPGAGGGERRFERGEQAANCPRIPEMR